MKKSSSQNPDTAQSLRNRGKLFLLGSLFLLLLTIGVSVIRQPSFLPWFGLSSPPQEQEHETTDEEEGSAVDLMTVAALSLEETTTGRFRSGGLGLSRTTWEILHGQPEQPSATETLYQGKTYKVTYRQDLVWQIEKSWGTTNPTPKQARTRIRRYLPLDSRLAETVTNSDGLIVDVYRSYMLAQLLSPQPAAPIAKKTKRRQKDLPTESCVVVHRITKQKVIFTLLHIGSPKPEGYLPPQSQTIPTKTTASKEPAQPEARKAASPNGKGRTQGRS